ncbi:MAG: hypothetical protein GY839_04350 [candidate division Zixibacteria bacterium]|nr:hypothetical protein [candidate division Zixibacteria bacterium]
MIRKLLITSALIILLLLIVVTNGQYDKDKPPPFEPEQKPERLGGRISPGEVKLHEISLDRADLIAFNLSWGSGEVDLAIITPEGTRVDSAFASKNDLIEYASVDIPEDDEFLGGYRYKAFGFSQSSLQGTWTVEVIADSNNIEETSYGVGTSLRGPDVILKTHIDKYFYRSGDFVLVIASLERKSLPLLGASVMARVFRMDTLIEKMNLYDDGTHGDSVSGDGRYTGTFINTSHSSAYSMKVYANQTGQQTFSREGRLLQFSVWDSQSKFDGSIVETAEDTNNDNLFNELKFDIGLDIAKEGKYHINGSLVDYNKARITNTRVETVLTTGNHTVGLAFDGSRIYTSGIDGPYILDKYSCFEIFKDSFSLVDLVEDDYQTQAYGYREFQRDPIYYTGNSSYAVNDKNGDGLYESITVYIEFDIIEENYYNYSAGLYDNDWKHVCLARDNEHLKPGIVTISLTFSGTEIRRSGKDGPYVISDFMMYCENGTSITLTDNITTDYYQSSDFKGK